MQTEERIARTLEFVRESYARSEHFRQVPRDGVYRWDHTLRVAALGRRIARAEGLNEEWLVLGCLLHDVSYCNEYDTYESWREHGRDAARIARPFLQSLELPAEAVEEICYGIAIHVDDEADFAGERTPLAVSIGDCDNLDRLDVYRLYENLSRREDYADTIGAARIEKIAQREQHMREQLSVPFATETARRIWEDRVGFQLEFYRRLREQMESGDRF